MGYNFSMKKALKYIVLLCVCLFTLSSCGETKVNVITNEPFLLYPIEAAEFFSYFSKEGLKVSVDKVHSPQMLIKFLNFSTYNVVLTDKKTADFITSKLSDWVKLCKIAQWRGDFYFLLIKDSLLKNQEVVVKFLKGWTAGVNYLKDPVVKKVLKEEKGIFFPKGVKFFSCKGW